MAENIGLSGKETEQGIKRNGVIVVGLGPGGAVIFLWKRYICSGNIR